MKLLRDCCLRLCHLALLLCCAPHALSGTVPDFTTVKAQHRVSEAWLLDRHGTRLHTLRMDKSVRRLPWISLNALSPAMQEALLASEDKRFYQHGGVDWKAVLAAAWERLLNDSPRGASTLSMQMAAMLDPTLDRKNSGRSYAQKWDQMQAARDLERAWSKPQILEAYLNGVTFRGELSGIGAASWGLFQKHSSGLNKAEASLLAALLRGPNAAPDKVATRGCDVAQKLSPPQPSCKVVTALAWSTLVVRPRIELQDQLAPHLARQLLTKPGQVLKTTLDAPMQRLAIDTLQRHLAELKDHQVEDGAIVVLDNKRGEILAYVGSSLLTSDAPDVDAVRAPRQAGSTFKPFLYALALEQQTLTAASLLDDSPLAVETAGGQYLPQNYERDFKGWVTLRTALASSLNVPAVRTLTLLGYEDFYTQLKNLGLSTLSRDADFYGYSLALGGAEVSLLELSNAYRTLANGGKTTSTSPLPRNNNSPPRQTIHPGVAWIIADILADRDARALTFGLDNALSTPAGWTAVKTGTSKDMRDNWAIGFSDTYTVGVWVGNASGEPMHEVSGVTGAAPVWQAMMQALHAHKPSRAPKAPAGVVFEQVRFHPEIEPPRREAFIAGTQQSLVALPTPQTVSPRIVGPGDGAILALDPDIPAGNQLVWFSSRPKQRGLVWRVDDQNQPAREDGSLAWQVSPGVHVVHLLDAQGTLLDAMRITVRAGIARR